MNFSDFRTFPHCSYRVDIGWDHLEFHISTSVEETKLDLNPDFQRGHVWTEQQQSAFCEYILKGGTSGKELYFNHPGWMKDWKGEYVIVDGKQRLEAVRCFMRNEIKVFGHYLSEFSNKPDIITARFSWNVASVKTRAEVLQWYLDFNAGGTPHSQDEIERVRNLLEQEKNLDISH